METFLKDSEAEPNMRTAPTVAPQQCGREPDAYEVRCTDGNYDWRRPYHGELEVIMRTGRDRSGKPFEYRALYAAVSPLSTVTPAEVAGMVERLRYAENVAINDSHAAQTELSSTPAADNEYADNRAKLCAAVEETISLIQSQAARIASLEAWLRPFARIAEVEDFAGTKDGESIIVNVSLCRTARDLLNKGFSHD